MTQFQVTRSLGGSRVDVGTMKAHGLFSTSDMVPGLVYMEPSRRSDEGVPPHLVLSKICFFIIFIPTWGKIPMLSTIFIDWLEAKTYKHVAELVKSYI